LCKRKRRLQVERKVLLEIFNLGPTFTKRTNTASLYPAGGPEMSGPWRKGTPPKNEVLRVRGDDWEALAIAVPFKKTTGKRKRQWRWVSLANKLHIFHDVIEWRFDT